MKIVAIIAGVLIIIMTALAFYAPTTFKLERSIVIDRPRSEVFEELKYLKNHELWNAWSKKDPHAKKEFIGTDGTVGFISSWESDHPELGTAEQVITGIQEDEKLTTEIRMKKPFEGAFISYITTSDVAEGKTNVTLGMESEAPFPFNVLSFIVNVCLGNQEKIVSNIDESLASLKAVLEQSAASAQQ